MKNLLGDTRARRVPVACLSRAWLSIIQLLTHFSSHNFFPVQRMGCFKDTPRRAMPILEGKSKLLRGNYKRRKFAIRKCAMVAVNRGYKMFGVQDGGQCASGPLAYRTYGRFGRSNRCRNNKGGPWANDVYRVSGTQITSFPLKGTVPQILAKIKHRKMACTKT